MFLKVPCVLVFFTLYMREGLSEDYDAKVSANINLQVRFCFFITQLMLLSEISSLLHYDNINDAEL